MLSKTEGELDWRVNRDGAQGQASGTLLDSHVLGH